ncbi:MULTISPECIES: hypothetical protein [unclassified Nonomuraea]|uniref:hypothetical protein n=1 Tax=unclassified Nonomuraea TaxID=2593643 RepID=UPI0033F9973B
MGGDDVYGQDPRLRGLLEQCGVGYVLAIAGNRQVKPDGTDSSAADSPSGWPIGTGTATAPAMAP